MLTFAKTRKASISAKIIRANGQIEDLGVVWRSKGIIRNIIDKIDKIKTWLQF
mgnify:CR=1 FL=1